LGWTSRKLDKNWRRLYLLIPLPPTVLGSTLGSVGLFYKVQESHVGPAGIICQQVHYIDIAGAIAAEIPAVDSPDQMVGDRKDPQVEPPAD
jgi:predicted aconitase with swiveling domain